MSANSDNLRSILETIQRLTQVNGWLRILARQSVHLQSESYY